jgi:hypothetical protein
MSLQAIELFTGPGDVIEIRALGVGRTASSPGCIYSGYFERDNHKAIIQALRQLDGKSDGIYTTINRVNSALLARSSNRLQARPKNTTTDADIIARTHLYIDVDSVRPAGISATDDEHQAAIDCARQIASDLTEMGFPEPFIADSGNGGHLQYRLPAVDLAAGDDLVKGVLIALDAKYSTAKVKIDTATGNRSRICRLYGTMARKGDSTPDRPYRRSTGLSGPERFEAVPLELLERLAAEAPDAQATLNKPPRETVAFSGAQFDIEDWIGRVNLDVVKGPDAYQGGRRWILKACPFNPEHTERPAIIQLPSGALIYKCQHKSCAENNWKAFRDYYEPDRARTNTVNGKPSPPPAAESEASRTELIIYDVASLMALELPPPAELIEGHLPLGGASLLVGKPKSGKTVDAVQIAIAVASGNALYDYYKILNPGPAMMIEQDDPAGPASVKDILSKSRVPVAGIPFYLVPKVPFYFGLELIDWLENQINEKSLRLLVLDSYTALRAARSMGCDLVKTEQTDLVMLDELAKRTGCTILIIHHGSKGSSAMDWDQQAAGSFAMAAAVESQIHISRFAELDGNAPERLVRVQGRHLAGTEMVLRFRRNSIDYEHVLEGAAATVYPLIQQLRNAFGTQSFSPKDISEHTGASRATAHRQIARLYSAGVLSKKGYGDYVLA